MIIHEVLKLEFEGDDIKNFKSAMKKLNEDKNRAGFNHSSLSADELKLLSEVSEKINK